MIVKKYKGFDVPEGATHYHDEYRRFYKDCERVSFSDFLGDQWSNWTASLHVNMPIECVKLPQEPEAYMPKAGEECEMLIIKWEPVMPLFVGEQVVVVEIATAEISYSISAMEFRPIKTEREKVIEWINSNIDNIDHYDSVLIGRLYDAGALKMPDNHE